MGGKSGQHLQCLLVTRGPVTPMRRLPWVPGLGVAVAVSLCTPEQLPGWDRDPGAWPLMELGIVMSLLPSYLVRKRRKDEQGSRRRHHEQCWALRARGREGAAVCPKAGRVPEPLSRRRYRCGGLMRGPGGDVSGSTSEAPS